MGYSHTHVQSPRLVVDRAETHFFGLLSLEYLDHLLPGDGNDTIYDIGGIDTLARALLVAADMIEQGTLTSAREQRYAGWSGELGSAILDGTEDLASLEAKVMGGSIDPVPVSGRQELLENRVNRVIWNRKG